MLTPLDVLLNLLPPTWLVLGGYSLMTIFSPRSSRGLSETWIVSVIYGSALLILPAVVVGPLIDGSLSKIFWGYTSLVPILLVYVALRRRSSVALLSTRLKLTIHQLLRGEPLQVVACGAMLVLAAKSLFILSFGSFGADSMTWSLPVSLYLKEFGGFGSFADPPGVMLVFAWAMSTFGAAGSEAFRVIPFIYLNSIPVLVFLFAKKYLGRTVAMTALSLTALAPMLDQALLLWAHYADLPALMFAFAGVYFLLRGDEDALSGICLTLGLLTKSLYGLAIAWSYLFLAIGSFRSRRVSSLLLGAGVFAVLLYSFLSESSKLSALSPTYARWVALAALGVLSTILLTRSLPPLQKAPRFGTVFLWLIPSFLWIGRQVVMGGSPLALPLIGMASADAQWWLKFRPSLSVPIELDWSILLSVFYQPSLDLYLMPFKVFGLVQVFRSRNKMLFMFAMTNALYYGSMGISYLSRHMAFLLFTLYPIASLGIISWLEKICRRDGRALQWFLLGYLFLSSLQDTSVYAGWEWVSRLPSSLLSDIARAALSFVVYPPWFDFPTGAGFQMVTPIAFGFIATLLVPVVIKTVIDMPGRVVTTWNAATSSLTQHERIRIRIRTRSRTSPHLSRMVIAAMFALFLLLPGYVVAVAGAGPNPLRYPIGTSWYGEQIAVAQYIVQSVPARSVVMTFAFTACYYLAVEGVYYVDLIQGTVATYPIKDPSFLPYLRQITEANDLQTLKTALKAINGRYILLPTSFDHTVPYEYFLFERFNGSSAFLEILRESNAMHQLWQYGHYALFAIDP